MAPNREISNNGSSNTSSLSSSSTKEAGPENKIVHNKQLPRLSMESLQRTISDISLELITKQALDNHEDHHDHDDVGHDYDHLEAIPETAAAAALEEAKCECCGMSEECTGEYVGRVRAEFGGRLVCGLCAQAVGEEMVKKGRPGCRLGRAEALAVHMSACSRFTKLGRTHPALFQAEAIKEILKKSSTSGFTRAKSLSPRDYNGKGIVASSAASGTSGQRIARSSSCIPAIRKVLD